MIKIIIITLSVLYLPHVKALEPLAEEELQQVLGQGGVYLSGDITINAAGGPLNIESDASNPAIWQMDCTASADARCGARIAVKTNNSVDSGWLVLDNIRGRFSFEGMTLKTRTINSGFDNGFDPSDASHDPNDIKYVSDGATFKRDVLEVGLPNTVKYSDVTFTLASSSEARPSDTGFQQTDLFNIRIDGNVILKGNLLLFPTGVP